MLIILVYVDNIIFGGTYEKLGAEFATLMGSEFEMSMICELNLFLGLHLNQTPKGMPIHQQKYIKKLLTKFNMQDVNVNDTLMATTTNLSTDEARTSVDETKYRGMIWSLLYLTAGWPDIVFSVGIYVHFQSKPKESHMKAIK